jgi:hypothetical protein
MKSIIYTSEKVVNTERRFGAAPHYYPARVVFQDGNEAVAMFTLDQLQVAISRGRINPEDVPQKTLWKKLFGG